MIVSENILFKQIFLSDLLRWQLNVVQNEVDSISRDQFLSNSDEQIVDFIYAKMEIIPLAIYQDRAILSDPKEIRITQGDPFDRGNRLPGVSVEVSLPYTGESNLWKMQPSKFTINFPRGDYSPQRDNDHAGILHFKMEYVQNEFQTNKVNQEIERNLQTVEEYLGWIKQDVEAHNPQLQNEIRRQVSQRRERLGAIQSVSKTLNIPIQVRDGMPAFSEIPLQMKIIEPLPTFVNRPKEFGISEKDFENILGIIRHMCGTFERTPQTYSVHDEEQLRDILLASLNGYYKNLATGETFRKKGKTDICIEIENRAAFVAECKVWKGDKMLLEAVDQLLGYLIWHDSKTAIIIFNKDIAGFAKLQEKINGILHQHVKFVHNLTIQESGEWRMVFRSSEDPDRMVTVHVFLFDLYTRR